MQDIWLPSNTPNSKTLGKFEEFTKHIVDRNGDRKSITKLMLYTKVPGVAEQASRPVLDDSEGRRIKEEYSAAYDLYLKAKEAEPKAEPVPTATEFGLKGTPIEHSDFLGKDQLAKLKMMGFYTIEQIADMSDMACQNVGRGAMTWRKKAKEYLAANRAS